MEISPIRWFREMKSKRWLNPWLVGTAATFLVLILFILSVNVCLLAVGFRAFTIASGAMAPTLQSGDRILVDTRAYTVKPPERGDVVAFVRPDVGNSLFVKRVVAVGGDVIEGTGDVIKLNGAILHEPYVAPIDMSNDPPTDFGPITVPPDALFLIGDARQNSNDSRYFGCVNLKQIRGRVAYIYWSKDSSKDWTRVR
jgi:signal peptidase I